MPVLALIHTSPVLVPAFNDLCARHLPGIEVFNIADESLIRNTIKAGRLEKTTVRRLGGYIQSARDAGADAVLVTCSSIGPAVTLARTLFDFPLFRIDEAMAEKAVHDASRIGVLATLSTTLEPTMELVRATAAAAGKTIELRSVLCEGAFDAVLRGDTGEHDRLVREGLARLLDSVDLVLLAQASMARAVDGLPESMRAKPILASPELAILRVKSEMERIATSAPQEHRA
jgi:Asp/Glu/hydantoin racemase